jgi:hypothetical protein
MASAFDWPVRSETSAINSENVLHIEFPINHREPGGATPQHFPARRSELLAMQTRFLVKR